MEETKKCPYCGEEILAVAKKCKHCGEWLEPKEDAVPAETAKAELPPVDWEAERAKYQAKAEAGDAEACFDMGRTYMNEGDQKNEDITCYRAAYSWFRKAADGGMNDANLAIAMVSNFNGVDDNLTDADGVNYLKRFIDNFNSGRDDQQFLSMAYCMLAEKCANGRGIQRDIPKAYQWARQSVDMGCEEAKAVVSDIEAKYPMNEDGEIDLDTHGRSAWLTLFLVLGILGSVWGFVFPQLNDEVGQIYGAPFYVGMAVNLAVYVGVLFWQRWAGWTMLAQLVLAPVAFYAGMKGMSGSGFHDLSATVQLCMSQMCNPFVSIFILLFLQRRKQGAALPVCSLFDIRDDGRNFATRVKDKLMAYGEGEEYLSDSEETQRFRYLCMAATATVVAMGVYVAYCYITSDRQWGMDIEWRVWKSPSLWFFLSFIGFFAQFFDWQHFSYETYYEWEDPHTGKKKREKKNDVLDVAEGQFLWPLLMHFIFVPAAYGAAFYYIIMGVMALVGALIPWVVGALCIAFSVLFYTLCRHLYPRRWRTLLLLAWCLFALFLLLVVCVPAKTGGSHDDVVAPVEEQYTDVDSNAEPEGLPSRPFTEVESFVDEGNEEATEENADVIEEAVDGIAEPAPDDAVETETVEAEAEAEETSTTESDVKVFDMVEQMPEFPGGQGQLMRWLSENVKYPAAAEENGAQGRVVCSFIVERDGSITSVQVVKSVDPSLDKEAVRVLKKMPKWIPGKQDGVAVRVKYAVPVTFRLQ